MKVIAGRKTANGKLIISEKISFECSDSSENGITRECLDKHVEQGGGRKSGGQEAEFQERI